MANTSAEALQELQQFNGSLQTPQAALDAAKSTLGVSGAQQTAQGLQTAIGNTTKLLGQVAPSVYGRTANSLVTSAGAGRQIANESAPLQSTLAKQGTDYTNAQQNYTDLMGQAENQAGDTLTQQNTRASLLQGIYNNLYGQEKDASAAAEAKREFDAQLAESRASRKASAAAGASYGSTSAGTGGGSTAAPTAGKAFSTQRKGGGFNFTDASGKAISAAQYAGLTGAPISSILYSMGQSGDKYAQAAYTQIKANQGYYNSHPDVLKKEFSSIFWGT